ncbi:MAG TPA: four-carbon acid sugar kinase family protein, partial [Candidatus Sumerlaeota bacterium]|nr:four-carbon acid sugar kinase family protein [Candidatus Sumerlaeota bacterium]
MSVLVLADDLTGLAEVACQAARYGLGGPMALTPAAPRGQPDTENNSRLFVNLGCRALPPAEAGERIRDALAGPLKSDGGDRVFLKIDSTARGPIPAMLAALHAACPETTIPLCLVNPATGRSVREGRLHVKGDPVDRTEFARDPLHPVTDACLPRWLAHPELRVERESRSPSGGRDVAILDGETDADLAAATRRWADSPVAAGTAAFGLALLRSWSGSPAPAPAPQWTVPPNTLVVVGTKSPSGRALIEDFGQTGRRAAPASEGVQTAAPRILHSPAEDASPEAVLAKLVRRTEEAVSRRRPDLLIILGGETALDDQQIR